MPKLKKKNYNLILLVSIAVIVGVVYYFGVDVDACTTSLTVFIELQLMPYFTDDVFLPSELSRNLNVTPLEVTPLFACTTKCIETLTWAVVDNGFDPTEQHLPLLKEITDRYSNAINADLVYYWDLPNPKPNPTILAGGELPSSGELEDPYVLCTSIPCDINIGIEWRNCEFFSGKLHCFYASPVGGGFWGNGQIVINPNKALPVQHELGHILGLPHIQNTYMSGPCTAEAIANGECTADLEPICPHPPFNNITAPGCLDPTIIGDTRIKDRLFEIWGPEVPENEGDPPCQNL